MGVLDDLLGTQTTAATDAATQAAQQNIANTTTQNNGILRGTTNSADTLLQTGATNAAGALNAGYGAATGAVTGYGAAAQNELGTGTNNAVGTIQSGNGAFAPYATNGGAASGLLSDALGINGASGNAAATSAFQASPGYQYSVDQASDAAARKAASLGLSASGNTLSAITTLGQNLANQDYNSWLTNLQGVGSQGLTAAQGVSSNDQASGNIQANAASTGAQLLQNTGQNLGTLDAAQGVGVAGVNTGLGTALSGNLTGLGQNVASSNLTSATDQANLGVADANAQDTAANKNASLFSGALSTFLSPITSAASKGVSGALAGATGGFL